MTTLFSLQFLPLFFQINPENFQVVEEEIGTVQQILNQENNTPGKYFFSYSKWALPWTTDT